MKPTPSLLRPLLLAVGLFVAGFITGIFVGGSFLHHEIMGELRRGSPHMGEFMLKRLTSDLDLDSAQVQQIKPIVDQISKETNELHLEYRPRLHTIFDRYNPEILKVLRPDQQIKFKKHVEDIRKGEDGPRPASPEHP
jgi:hypothetical protein